MKRWIGWLIAGVAALGAVPALAEDGPKTPKGTVRAQRIGWMAGMQVGEAKGQPHPLIFELVPNSDAQRKGIRVGDELIRWDDEEVRSLDVVFEKAQRMRPGREVSVWVRRGSQTLNFLIRNPKNPGPTPEEKAKTDEKKPQDEAKSADGEGTGEGDKDKKKSKKKKKPIVIKPIPAEQ